MDQTHKRVPILKTSRNARVLRLHRSNDLFHALRPLCKMHRSAYKKGRWTKLTNVCLS